MPTAKPLAPGEKKSEQLLAAEGPWALVEQKDEPDPLKDHMNARSQVNPKNINGARPYTRQPTAKDLDQPIHFRVLKLERQMEGLQDDFHKLLPPLTNLAASDDQLTMTLEEIKARQDAVAKQHKAQYNTSKFPLEAPKVLASGEPSVHANKPLKVAPPPPPPEAPPPKLMEKAAVTPPLNPPSPLPGAMDGAAVTGVRIGAHPGKVRIVLDLSGPTGFATDLDNGEKLLLVQLPEAAWSAEGQKILKNKYVRSYSAQKAPSGAGTTLAIELTGPAKVTATALPPNESYGQRIVLDISSL